jgi:hypothetical protein
MDHLEKVQAGLDGLHIYEAVLLAEMTLEAVVKPASVC